MTHRPAPPNPVLWHFIPTQQSPCCFGGWVAWYPQVSLSALHKLGGTSSEANEKWDRLISNIKCRYNLLYQHWNDRSELLEKYLWHMSRVIRIWNSFRTLIHHNISLHHQTTIHRFPDVFYRELQEEPQNLSCLNN